MLYDPNGKWIETNITRYDKNGIEKKWYNIFRRTAEKRVDITVHDAKVYNGSSASGAMKQVAGDIQKEIESNWTTTTISPNGKKTVNTNVKFEGGISIIDNLDDPTLTTRGKTPSTLFFIADFDAIEQFTGNPEAGAFVPNNSNLIVLSSVGTITPSDFDNKGISHEFSHVLGLHDNNNFASDNMTNNGRVIRDRKVYYREAIQVHGNNRKGYTTSLNRINRIINR